LKKLSELTVLYRQQIVSKAAISDEQFDIKNRYVGKVVAKEQLADMTNDFMGDQINSCLAMMVNTVIF